MVSVRQSSDSGVQFCSRSESPRASMAFRSKLGSLITHSISKSILPNGQAPMMRLMNSVRYMSSKLFTGGLSNDDSLKQGFDSFANLTEARLNIDRDTGRSRGFGSMNVVHVLLKKKKTFVTVTDAKGNKKTGASAGCLEDRKGRARNSRYAAEATAEHVGRSARKMGLKSVVMKVKGSSFFRKKRKVIMSWREGFRGEGVDQSPIMYIHDVTQLPHNGCRLPKRQRK